MRKPRLIYYVSVGHLYAQLTNISIYSLLKNGQYTDEILVFGDEFFFKNNIFNVKVHKIIQEDFHPVFNVQTINYHPCFYRIFLADTIDVDKYSQIMYLDSDIEILHNIYPMFQADNSIYLTSEWYHTFSVFEYPHFCTSSCFTEEEFEKYKNNHIINSGSFCVDSSLFLSFMEQWKNKINNFPLIFGTDQSTLNLMVLNNEIDYKLFDDGVISFPNHIETRDRRRLREYQLKKEKEIVYHFLTPQLKEILINKYKNIYPLSNIL